MTRNNVLLLCRLLAARKEPVV